MTQEQNTLVEKMIKGPKNNPSPSHIYAESNAVAKLELILWHKYEREIVSNETESS